MVPVVAANSAEFVGPKSRKRRLKRFRYYARRLLELYPDLFLTVMRWRFRRNDKLVAHPVRHGLRPVRASTEILIEGFPRSANTTAVKAFVYSQNRPVRIADHIHSHCQVQYAARRGMPTLVLIRDPKSAIVSQLLLEPWIGINARLRQYAIFYEHVLQLKDHFVAARFETCIADFDSLILALNKKFDRDFALKGPDGPSYREVIAYQYAYHERIHQGDRYKKAKDETSNAFDLHVDNSDHSRRLFDQATGLYCRFLRETAAL